MKYENIYFVDFGLEHITILAAKIKNNRLIDIPLVLEKKVNIPYQKPHSALEQVENFETLLSLIDEMEKKLKTNISSVILIIKYNAINVYFTKCKIDFKKKQKVSQLHKEKLASMAIKSFFKKTNDEYSILDIICNNFVLDQQNCVKNPYKMICQLLTINATIIGIKNSFTKYLSSYLSCFKIHTQHYISPCVSVFNLIKTFLPKDGNFLFIDFGSCSTEYCITQNNCLKHLDIINFGGFDITKDIADEMKIHSWKADILKKKISNSLIENTESKTTKFIIKSVENIIDTKLIEIIERIKMTINDYQNNLSFKKIYIFGGVSEYKNIKNIVGKIFNTQVEILNDLSMIDNKIISKAITFNKLTNNSLQLLCAVDFYIKNLNSYKNAKRGFLFKVPSKFSCFLKDLLY